MNQWMNQWMKKVAVTRVDKNEFFSDEKELIISGISLHMSWFYCHVIKFGRMRKMVQKKALKSIFFCFKKASDANIIINYAVKYSILVGIPVVVIIVAPKSVVVV